MSASKKRPKPIPAPRSGQPRRTALITGITGQDGSYLAELLLAKGYEVVGVVRRTSHDSYERIGHLLDRVHIVPADLLDQHSLTTVVRDAKPDEIYNLAAQSFVSTSWNQLVLTGEFTVRGVTRLLEAVRLAHPLARVYQASSHEMFGKLWASCASWHSHMRGSTGNTTSKSTRALCGRRKSTRCRRIRARRYASSAGRRRRASPIWCA